MRQKSLLIISFFLASVSVNLFCDVTIANKTILRPQTRWLCGGVERFNRYNESTKNQLIRNLQIQASGMYSCSFGKAKAGKLLGFAGKNEISIGPGSDYDVNIESIIHKGANDGTNSPTMRGTLKILPQVKVQGFKLAARKWMQDFFCEISTTFEHVENSLGLEVSGETRDSNSLYGILDYFQGDIYALSGTSRLQDRLAYGKLTNETTDSNFADVSFTVGFDKFFGDKCRAGIYVEGMIPVSDAKTGIDLFEATVGSGDHVMIGAGTRCVVTVIDDYKYSCGVTGSFVERYFVEKNEMRTHGISIKDSTNTAFTRGNIAWGHYMLAGIPGEKGLIPLTNVLTQTTGVRPGMETIADFSYFIEGDRGTASVGYRFYARGSDSISVSSWDENKYKLIRDPQNYTAGENIAASGGGYATSPVLIDEEATRAPATSTHTFYFAGNFRAPTLPVDFGVGAAMEVATNNAALNNFELWSRLSVVF
ncbi:hypothetical protein HOD08_02285 [bacterium]|nr:hypothetical protein [bacterium]